MNLYFKALETFPLLTQMLTTGCLCGCGDMISQLVVERKSLSSFKGQRLLRFFTMGCFYVGPILWFWFPQLEKITIGGPAVALLFRVFVDQLIFGPISLSVFLILMSTLEGHSLNQSIRNWKQVFLGIFITGLKVWPAVALCNFYCVPLSYRFFVVQFVGLGWNTYLAFATNREKFAEVMIWRYYKTLLTKYPLGTQMLATGILCGGGDILSQLVVEKKSLANYQIERTLRFFGLGCFWVGPIIRTWFVQLEKVKLGGPKFAPLVRVALDQGLFGPCFLSSFLIIMRCLEGNSLSKSIEKWKRDIPGLVIMGLKIWPAIQLFNFYLIPLEHRVLVVQTAALGWNTYLAFVTNQAVPEIIPIPNVFPDAK